MEVLFLCLFRMQMRAIVLLRRLLGSRGSPERGVLFACSVRRSPFRSLAPWASFSSGAHVLVRRDGIGHCRRLGFTRLVTGIVPGRSISLGGKPFL